LALEASGAAAIGISAEADGIAISVGIKRDVIAILLLLEEKARLVAAKARKKVLDSIRSGRDMVFRPHFLTANTQTTPPCGTLFSMPILFCVANASWMRCASTPQPDWTAIYLVPSAS